jgi:DNA adenine methylase
MSAKKLKPPFPYFGGKSSVAPLVWPRFGASEIANYVEPFCGSAAMLLARPGFREGANHEVINDADGFVANFWRAMSLCPEEVIGWADRPVMEVDLSAASGLLYPLRDDLAARLREDMNFCDPKVAGLWVWGVSAMIAGPARWPREHVYYQVPTTGGRGIHGTQNTRRGFLEALVKRLSRVKVICGDWRRVCTDSFTTQLGRTAIFFDPPYLTSESVYSASAVYQQVVEFCLERGGDPQLRIALCGYEGEGADELVGAGWSEIAWQSNGGYGNCRKSGKNENNKRERIWFSPHCLNEGMFFL